jgi:hypothetical protein
LSETLRKAPAVELVKRSDRIGAGFLIRLNARAGNFGIRLLLSGIIMRYGIDLEARGTTWESAS